MIRSESRSSFGGELSLHELKAAVTDHANEHFHAEIDALLEDAPMSPVRIERHGAPDTILMTEDLYRRLREDADGVDEPVDPAR